MNVLKEIIPVIISLACATIQWAVITAVVDLVTMVQAKLAPAMVSKLVLAQVYIHIYFWHVSARVCITVTSRTFQY